MIQDKALFKEEIVEIARRLHARNMLAAADGNISVRISDDEIWITPTGRPKSSLAPDEMARITLDNKIISGNPSSERLMHLALYRACPEARAIVHAHPPTAIAWSLARPDWKELPFDGLPEVILALGGIPIVPYARPSTQAMGDYLLPFLPKHRALILARHGAISWGDSLNEAYSGMERLEHTSHILKLAHELGGMSPLPPSEVSALLEMRRLLGPRSL